MVELVAQAALVVHNRSVIIAAATVGVLLALLLVYIACSSKGDSESGSKY